MCLDILEKIGYIRLYLKYFLQSKIIHIKNK